MVYDAATKTLSILSVGNPGTVQVATADNLVVLHHDNITFDSITFSGSNEHIFNMTNANNTTINNCDFLFAGLSGIYSNTVTGTTVENSRFESINRNWLEIYTNGDYAIVNNTIVGAGLAPGMIGRAETNYAMRGITVNAFDNSNVLIEGNTVQNTGYKAVEFSAATITVENNLIQRFCSILDDCGGIYTSAGYQDNGYSAANRIIDGNIVLDGQSATDGQAAGSWTPSHGIYMDGGTDDVTITNNTSANNLSGSGYFGNDNYNIELSGNLFFDNNGAQFSFADVNAGTASTNFNVNNNVFFSLAQSIIPAATISDPCFKTEATSASINSIFNGSDNNYFVCRLDPTTIFDWYNHTTLPTISEQLQTLMQWQTANSIDAHSHTTPKQTSTASDIRFEYNFSSAPKVIALGAPYVSVDGTVYSTSITLLPYRSVVLILQ